MRNVSSLQAYFCLCNVFRIKKFLRILLLQIVEEPQSGASPIAFPVTRALGSIGPLNITWSITPQNSLYAASGDDLSQTKGKAMQSNSSFKIVW